MKEWLQLGLSPTTREDHTGLTALHMAAIHVGDRSVSLWLCSGRARREWGWAGGVAGTLGRMGRSLHRHPACYVSMRGRRRRHCTTDTQSKAVLPRPWSSCHAIGWRRGKLKTAADEQAKRFRATVETLFDAGAACCDRMHLCALWRAHVMYGTACLRCGCAVNGRLAVSACGRSCLACRMLWMDALERPVVIATVRAWARGGHSP